MLQPINFAKSGLRYVGANKHKKKENKTREVHFTMLWFRTKLRHPNLGKPCYTVGVCCMNLDVQVQGDNLNAGRFVVWLLLLYFMRHEKQNIS